jgi:deoxyribose-phosphate aldolase
MVAAGCNEIDMVMNIGKLVSGDLSEVKADVKAVADVVLPRTMKVIIEYSVLTYEEAKQACEICVDCGVTFVKTGTGWIGRGTTVEDVRFIKSVVGDRARIKASGGIRDLAMLVEMYKEGASRFGVNLRSGISIVEEAQAFSGGITF